MSTCAVLVLDDVDDVDRLIGELVVGDEAAQHQQIKGDNMTEQIANRARVTAMLDDVAGEMDRYRTELAHQELASSERFSAVVAEVFVDNSSPIGLTRRRIWDAYLDRMEDQGAGDLLYVSALLERKLGGLEQGSIQRQHLSSALAAIESAIQLESITNYDREN